jgi:hypothetical protein
MTNNVGDPTDSSGQVAIDFAWGNFPIQPNDDRAGSVSNIGGGTGDYGWSATTQVASARLDATLDNHAIVEAGYAGYPSFTAGIGNYIVTAAKGDGTTVTYTSQNFLAAGQVVNITGLTASAYNLSSATVASSNATSFTVTNSANAGVITGQIGKVEVATAAGDGDGAGIGNILVPSVLGLTTANALDGLKDRGFENANITNTTGTTAKQPTRINVTATTAANVYVSSANTLFSVGSKVKIAAGTGVPAAVVNTSAGWEVTAVASTYITIKGTGWTVADTGAITPGTVLTGASGTVTYQSQAAGSSVASNGSITILSWA